ncbi:hypothetical protein GN956_G2504 [Arapaima gigas]
MYVCLLLLDCFTPTAGLDLPPSTGVCLPPSAGVFNSLYRRCQWSAASGQTVSKKRDTKGKSTLMKLCLAFILDEQHQDQLTGECIFLKLLDQASLDPKLHTIFSSVDQRVEAGFGNEGSPNVVMEVNTVQLCSSTSATTQMKH